MNIYVYSKEEKLVMDKAISQIKDICKEKYKIKSPVVEFSSKDGYPYKKIHDGKLIKLYITDDYNVSHTLEMKISFANGLLAYYIVNDKKVFVSKLKDIAKNNGMVIKKGYESSDIGEVSKRISPKKHKKNKNKDKDKDEMFISPNNRAQTYEEYIEEKIKEDEERYRYLNMLEEMEIAMTETYEELY